MFFAKNCVKNINWANKETIMKVKLIAAVSIMFMIISQRCMSDEPTKTQWVVHDMNRPHPAVVTAGEQPGQAPSDAIILFDGNDLSQWVDKKGEPARWKVENGYMEVVAKTGDIHTKQSFGDCQLHVEWAAPQKADGNNQHPGNSGVFLMSTYELQVLDSYENVTYADGQAAAIYGQSPPMVNACRKPGQWQSYDIFFRAPKFDKDGKVVRKAKMTVLHNGVLVQDNFELTGPTAHKKRPPYTAHADKLPLSLHDHGQPVRFRNIWIREITAQQ